MEMSPEEEARIIAQSRFDVNEEIPWIEYFNDACDGRDVHRESQGAASYE